MADKKKKKKDAIDSAIEKIIASLGGGGTVAEGDNLVLVPGWLYTAATGTESQGDFVSISTDSLANLAFKLKLNKPKQYARLSNYLLGSSGADVEDVDAAFRTAINIAGAAGSGLDNVLSNSDFRSLIRKSGGSGGGGGSRTATYITLTDRPTAANNLKKNMQLLLGREPSKEELNSYVKKLNAKERALATKTTQSAAGATTVGNDFDREMFTLQYVINAAGGNFDEGTLGSTMDSIATIARDYGVSSAVTPNRMKKLTKQLILGEVDADTIRGEFAKSASSMYGAFKDDILADPKRDIRTGVASDYIGLYANTFDVDEDSVDVSEVLGKASANVNGTPQKLSLNDFRIALRSDPRFQTTSTAKQEAARAGVALARMMGVNI